MIGTVGRKSNQVRLRVIHHTDSDTLERHVHQFALEHSILNTDEWPSYNHVQRTHSTVQHGRKEWARDNEGDGIREVHTNTIEGLWTTLRNFLRIFRGVHKTYLSQYVAICEFSINLKCVSVLFVELLVANTHSFYT